MAEYKQAVLYFTTGTGNSFRAAKWLEQFAQELGAAVKLIRAEQADPREEINDNPETIIGLVMPTHAFTAPWHIIKFALRMPAAKSAAAFVLSTRAGLRAGKVFTPGINGTGNFIIAAILAAKGYKVRGIMSLDMPSNWITVHPSLSPKSVSGIEERGIRKTEWFANQIFSGKKVWLTRNNIYEAILGLLLLPVSLLYLIIGRFFLAKLFFANNNCTSCGVCEKNCPLGAVKLWGKKKPWPYWSYDCESCMRCMNFCPEKAIEAGHSWAVILYYLTSVPAFKFILAQLVKISPAMPTPKGFWTGFLSFLVFFYPALILSYLVFHLLTRIPAINAFFTYTTFTHIFSRYHEPETKLQDIAPRT